MSELGKAYVQIVPSAKGISGSISKELGGEAVSAGQSAGSSIAGAIKGAIAAAGIGTAIKSALEAGGNLQQSFGGLDTLYGEAADAAKKYAVEAANAGISANSYAEQAVSFGAALKQAFEGDTIKAAEAANTAILDMADNAAKMGTPIENIQTAYQGFAKQNYTMLDNLKLGYGGTKTEMERLLADAQKLSGVEYNLDNLGDVYEAIHVIQQDLGLTGVAAQEASETFSGSLGAMKAAGENLLANLALGEDIGPALDTLSQTVQAFVFNNLFPMIGNMLQALPELLSGLSSIVIGALNQITDNADEIIQIGLDIVTSLVAAIVEAAPYLVEAAFSLVASLGKALIETDWISIANDLMNNLRDSIDLAAGEILGMDTATIDGFLEGITNALPGVLDQGISLVTSLAEGILQNIPALITSAGELLNKFTEFVMKNMPMILEKGFELVKNLAEGIIKNLPAIAGATLEVIAKLIATVGQNLPKILETGLNIIMELILGLLKAIPKVIAAIPQIIAAIKDTFGNYNWKQIGSDILEGVKKGIMDKLNAVVNAAKEAASAIWNAVKDFFDIGSPSKLMAYAGEMIDVGFAKGIEDSQGLVDDAMDTLSNKAVLEIQSPQTSFSAGQTQTGGQLVLNMTINGAEGQDVEALAEIIQEKINNAVRSRELVYA